MNTSSELCVVSGYWLTDDRVPALVRRLSVVFECRDEDVWMWIVRIEVSGSRTPESSKRGCAISNPVTGVEVRRAP